MLCTQLNAQHILASQDQHAVDGCYAQSGQEAEDVEQAEAARKTGDHSETADEIVREVCSQTLHSTYAVYAAAFIQLGLPSKNIPTGAKNERKPTNVGASTARITNAATLIGEGHYDTGITVVRGGVWTYTWRMPPIIQDGKMLMAVISPQRPSRTASAAAMYDFHVSSHHGAMPPGSGCASPIGEPIILKPVDCVLGLTND